MGNGTGMRMGAIHYKAEVVDDYWTGLLHSPKLP